MLLRHEETAHNPILSRISNNNFVIWTPLSSDAANANTVVEGKSTEHMEWNKSVNIS